MAPKSAQKPSRARLRVRWLLLSLLVSLSCLVGTLRSPLLAAQLVTADAPDGWLDEVESRPHPAIAKRGELCRVPAARPATGGEGAGHARLRGAGHASEFSGGLEPAFHAPAVALAIVGELHDDWRPPALGPHELMVLLN